MTDLPEENTNIEEIDDTDVSVDDSVLAELADDTDTIDPLEEGFGSLDENEEIKSDDIPDEEEDDEILDPEEDVDETEFDSFDDRDDM